MSSITAVSIGNGVGVVDSATGVLVMTGSYEKPEQACVIIYVKLTPNSP
ncbi:MAG: hypothetical protein P1S60_04930 [Anaerolineae bacterium]|nr:hypothetical protein [Anaerolineae bacterium]